MIAQNINNSVFSLRLHDESPSWSYAPDVACIAWYSLGACVRLSSEALLFLSDDG